MFATWHYSPIIPVLASLSITEHDLRFQLLPTLQLLSEASIRQLKQGGLGDDRHNPHGGKRKAGDPCLAVERGVALHYCQQAISRSKGIWAPYASKNLISISATEVGASHCIP